MKSVHVLCAAFTFIVGCSHTAHQLENKNADLANTASSSDRTNIQTIDLSQIGHLAPKGRVQDDYNRSPVVDQLVAAGPESIPYLISKLEDETEIEGHVMDFWYKVTIGDIAFIILSDFFTDSSWENTTIPEIGWDQMLERRNRDITGEQVLREYIAKHGRSAIKEKWQKIWENNKERLYWDGEEQCFKVKRA